MRTARKRLRTPRRIGLTNGPPMAAGYGRLQSTAPIRDRTGLEMLDIYASSDEDDAFAQ